SDNFFSTLSSLLLLWRIIQTERQIVMGVWQFKFVAGNILKKPSHQRVTRVYPKPFQVSDRFRDGHTGIERSSVSWV
ncbi:unnamed protein product, partial [Urochloa humidicola]